MAAVVAAVVAVAVAEEAVEAEAEAEAEELVKAGHAQARKGHVTIPMRKHWQIVQMAADIA